MPILSGARGCRPCAHSVRSIWTHGCSSLFPQMNHTSEEEAAAIKIQAHARGMMTRKTGKTSTTTVGSIAFSLFCPALGRIAGGRPNLSRLRALLCGPFADEDS